MLIRDLELVLHSTYRPRSRSRHPSWFNCAVTLGGGHYHTHFVDGETGAPEGAGACPVLTYGKSQSQDSNPALNPNSGAEK